MRIKYDPARRIFWLVTGNSISWMSEDYKVTAVSGFPYSNNFDLFENSQGEMWVLSSGGIYIVPTQELLKNVRLAADAFVGDAEQFDDLTMLCLEYRGGDK